MKKNISLLLILILVCNMLAVTTLTAGAVNTTRKPWGVWREINFDDELLGSDYYIRENAASYEFVDDEKGGKALRIFDMQWKGGGLEIDIGDILAATSLQTSEGYSVSFRIKANEGEDFYVSSLMYGGGDGYLGNNYSSWSVNDKGWTTVENDDKGGRLSFKLPDTDNTTWMNNSDSGKIIFLTTTGTQGDNGNPLGEAGTKGYIIDDIKIWAPYEERGEVSELIAMVEALPSQSGVTAADEPAIKAAEDAYAALGTLDTPNRNAADAAKAKVDKLRNILNGGGIGEEGALITDGGFENAAAGEEQWAGNVIKDAAKANSGEQLLYVTRRRTGSGAEEQPFWVTDINIERFKDFGAGNYQVSFYMRAANAGETTGAVPMIIGDTENGEKYYYFNMQTGTQGVNPAIAGDTWTKFTSELLPLDMLSSGKLYLINWYDENWTDLYLDDVELVFSDDGGDALNPFDPVFTYSDKNNLFAPYGDLETFTGNDLIWGQAQNAAPNYTLQTGKDAVYEGSQSLLISGRKNQYDNCSIDVTKIIKDNGSGKYYLSFMARTAQAGKTTGLCPQIYCTFEDGSEAIAYFMPEKYLCNIDDKWSKVGVNLNDLGYYFQYVTNEGGKRTVHELDSAKLRSARLIIYGNLEENDGYADYYIDDLRFWKYYEGQQGNETPNYPVVNIEPNYEYKNPDNLIDPYGSFETLEDGDKIWNGTVVNDPKNAHGGNNSLLISDRTKGDYRFDFCVTLNEVINKHGAGEYYYGCWLKTKEPGTTTVLQPILYYHDTAAEYWMSQITVTDEWTYFGVKRQDVENYFNAKEGGLPYAKNVAEFRFYNAPGQEEYPDYLVDDFAFWKRTADLPDAGETQVPIIFEVLLSISLLGVFACYKNRKFFRA